MKNTILGFLISAIIGVAATMILFVTEAISKQTMVDVLSKGGLAWLILALALLLVGFIKNLGNK